MWWCKGYTEALFRGLFVQSCASLYLIICSTIIVWLALLHGPKYASCLPYLLQIAFGEELVQAALLAPAQQLRQLSAAAAGEAPKEKLKGLLLQIEGVLGGARTCLPDLPGCEQPGKALGLVGRSGVGLGGGAAVRAAAAEALLAAAGCVGATDSDTLRQLVLAMDGVLAGGCGRGVGVPAEGQTLCSLPLLPKQQQPACLPAQQTHLPLNCSVLHCPPLFLAVGTSEYADSTSNLAAWNR
jgi:hypothetical protein